MRMNFMFVGALSFLLSIPGLALSPRNPEGEIAKYKLDRAQARTSTIIKKGALKMIVGPFKPKEGTAGTYPSTLFYDLKVLVAGHLKGSKKTEVPAEFFDPSFMERLKREGEIDNGIFKVKHLGMADAVTIFGIKYPNCDKVRIYDVKLGQTQDFEALLQETLGRAYLAQTGEDIPLSVGDIKNPEAILHIAKKIPVLGAVKMDLTAKVRGFDIKAGFDYLPPTVPDPDNGVKQP